MGFWPIKYLGAHVSGGRLREKDLEFVEEKQEFFLDGSQGGAKYVPGRKVLIDSSLNSGLIYYMSLFRFHKAVNFNPLKKQRCFFWQGGSSVMKYHMVKWDLIARPKEKKDWELKLEKMNTSLLVKWWWKLESKEGLWQKLVRAKYLRNRHVACVCHR
jgi:hypothetical protein